MRHVEIDVPIEVHMCVTETLSSLLRQLNLQVIDTLVMVIHLISYCKLCKSNHMSHTSTPLYTFIGSTMTLIIIVAIVAFLCLKH